MLPIITPSYVQDFLYNEVRQMLCDELYSKLKNKFMYFDDIFDLFLSEQQKNDLGLIMGDFLLNKKAGLAIQWLPMCLRKDGYVKLAALSENGLAILFCENLTREEIKMALYQDGMALAFLNSDLQNDKELVEIALNENIAAVKYMGDKLKQNPKYILELLNNFVLKEEEDYFLKILNYTREQIFKYLGD